MTDWSAIKRRVRKPVASPRRLTGVALTGILGFMVSCSGSSPYQPSYGVGGGTKRPGTLPGGGLPEDGSQQGNDDLQGSASYSGSGKLAVADNLLGDSLNNYPVSNSSLAATVRSAVFTLNSAGGQLGGSPKDEVRNGFQSINRQSVYTVAKSATWPAGDSNYSSHSYLVFAKSFTSGGMTYVADKPFPVFPVKQAAARDFGPLANGGAARFSVVFNNSIQADYVVSRVFSASLPGCDSGVFGPVSARLGDRVNTIGIQVAVNLRGGNEAYGQFPATSMVFVNDFRDGGKIPAIATCSRTYNNEKRNLAYLSLLYSLVSSQ